MLTLARRLWNDLRTGFWFLPFVLLVAHVAMAVVLTSTDLGANKPWMDQWPGLFGAGADGARGMLSTIAGSMMTVVGVTLSMTLVTLALASSQYTSRILRNFIRDRITQFVLGLFAGIYCYCLIVLRTIRGGDEGGFVPGPAVLFGVMLAVCGIIVLVYFIHHMATSIQASNIVASVAAETISAVNRMYPEDAVEAPSGVLWSLPDPPPRWTPILAARGGYIERINFHDLERIAQTHGTAVRIERGIGEFVVRGTPLLAVLRETVESEDLTSALTAAIDIGRHRMVDQDVGFGIRQLVDIALRALSPGINDTTTAIMCIDYLTAILARLATRVMTETDSATDTPGKVSNTRPPTFAGLLAEAFDQIREAGRANFGVLQRLLDALDTIGTLSTAAPRRAALLAQLDLIDETAGRSVESSSDRERVASIAQRIRSKLIRDLRSSGMVSGE